MKFERKKKHSHATQPTIKKFQNNFRLFNAAKSQIKFLICLPKNYENAEQFFSLSSLSPPPQKKKKSKLYFRSSKASRHSRILLLILILKRNIEIFLKAPIFDEYAEGNDAQRKKLQTKITPLIST